MWVLLVIGCSYDTVEFTGGGEVRVAVLGDEVDAAALFVVGMSQAEIDALFVDGHKPEDVLDNLDDAEVEPDHESGYFFKALNGGSFVEVVDNDVVGFSPCGLPIRHAELALNAGDFGGLGWIQFDERGPDDASHRPPDSLVAFETEGPGLSIPMEISFNTDDHLSGFAFGSVTVSCADGTKPATLSVQWEFDRDVHRRAHDRGWQQIVPVIIVD